MDSWIIAGVIAVAGNLAIGYLCGALKGNGLLGMSLALLLGPVGWLVALLMPRRTRHKAGQDDS